MLKRYTHLKPEALTQCWRAVLASAMADSSMFGLQR